MSYNNSTSQQQRIKQQLAKRNNIYSHSSTSTRDDIAIAADYAVAADIFPCQNPHTPDKSTISSRLVTFQNWPNHIRATPIELAKAGFIYLGQKDRLKCFYCNGGLQKWQYNEDPWFEHAKWFPNCEYLLSCKGIEYVGHVASQFPNLNRPSPSRKKNSSPSSNLESSLNSFSNTPSDSPSSSSRIQVDEIPSTSSDTITHKKSLSDAMDSYIVKQAIEMGFEEKLVNHVVKQKLQEGSEYNSVLNLVEDLQTEEPKFSSLQNELVIQDQLFAEKNQFNFNKSKENKELLPLPVNPNYTCDKTNQSASLELNSVGSENNSLSPTSPCSKSTFETIESIINEQTCKVCLDRRSNCLFQPCGHLCCCIDCGSVLKLCPICREKIYQIIKIYR